MLEITRLQEQIEKIFERKLNMTVPAADTDLFETGALDSLSFVGLLFELEREFSVGISLEELDLKNFRSIVRIAGFIGERLERQNAGRKNPIAPEPAEHHRRLEHG